MDEIILQLADLVEQLGWIMAAEEDKDGNIIGCVIGDEDYIEQKFSEEAGEEQPGGRKLWTPPPWLNY